MWTRTSLLFASGASLGVGIWAHLKSQGVVAALENLPCVEPQSSAAVWDVDWDRREPCEDVDLGYCADRHVILVCQGQDQQDAKKDSDKKLTSVGKEQMKKVADRLVELKFDYGYVMSSTAIAAQESLAIIIDRIKPKKYGVNEFLSDGFQVSPAPSRGLDKIKDHDLYKNVMRLEYAFRATFHRPDASVENNSYEVMICPSNVITYFVCRALQFPADGWMRFSIPQGSITWISIDKMGNVIATQIGESGHLDSDLITF